MRVAVQRAGELLAQAAELTEGPLLDALELAPELARANGALSQHDDERRRRDDEGRDGESEESGRHARALPRAACGRTAPPLGVIGYFAKCTDPFRITFRIQ